MIVEEVMIPFESVPTLNINSLFKEAIDKMNQNGLGIVCITNEENILKGIITDGDIRRNIIKVQKPFSALFVDDAINHAILNPITTEPETFLKDAVDLMEKKQIWDLPVIDRNKKIIGLLHLHQAVKILLK